MVIIKTMSRKSNVGQLIKYVLAEGKTMPKVTLREKAYDVYGIHLTELDKKHLLAEIHDAQICKLFKECNDDIELFMKALYSSQEKGPGALIKQNIRSRSIKGYIKEFEENEKLRINARKDAVQAHHTIISFSAKDSPHLTDAVMTDFAKHYISLRGAENLYVGDVHTDKDHLHLHLVMSGTQLGTGLSNRISRAEFQQIKVAMQQYQRDKYPQLVHSLPEHGKAKAMGKGGGGKNMKTPDRTTNKEVLSELLETTYAKSKSLSHFLEQLESQGHQPYFRSGRLQGIKFDGVMKFRLNRIGFDERKLQELDSKREKQDKAMQELRNLRSKGKEVENAATKELEERDKNADTQSSREDQALQEIASIRDSRSNENERDLERDENTKDIDTETEDGSQPDEQK